MGSGIQLWGGPTVPVFPLLNWMKDGIQKAHEFKEGFKAMLGDALASQEDAFKENLAQMKEWNGKHDLFIPDGWIGTMEDILKTIDRNRQNPGGSVNDIIDAMTIGGLKKGIDLVDGTINPVGVFVGDSKPSELLDHTSRGQEVKDLKSLQEGGGVIVEAAATIGLAALDALPSAEEKLGSKVGQIAEEARTGQRGAKNAGSALEKAAHGAKNSDPPVPREMVEKALKENPGLAERANAADASKAATDAAKAAGEAAREKERFLSGIQEAEQRARQFEAAAEEARAANRFRLEDARNVNPKRAEELKKEAKDWLDKAAEWEKRAKGLRGYAQEMNQWREGTEEYQKALENLKKAQAEAAEAGREAMRALDKADFASP